jgi:hypothetical protein
MNALLHDSAVPAFATAVPSGEATAAAAPAADNSTTTLSVSTDASLLQEFHLITKSFTRTCEKKDDMIQQMLKDHKEERARQEERERQERERQDAIRKEDREFFKTLIANQKRTPYVEEGEVSAGPMKKKKKIEKVDKTNESLRSKLIKSLNAETQNSLSNMGDTFGEKSYVKRMEAFKFNKHHLKWMVELAGIECHKDNTKEDMYEILYTNQVFGSTFAKWFDTSNVTEI